jgi:hypothetical protein
MHDNTKFTLMVLWSILIVFSGVVVLGLPALMFTLIWHRNHGETDIYDVYINIAFFLNLVGSILFILILILFCIVNFK